MDLNEVIEQLKSLKKHCIEMTEGEIDTIWYKDVQALEFAINVLTKEKDLPDGNLKRSTD